MIISKKQGLIIGGLALLIIVLVVVYLFWQRTVSDTELAPETTPTTNTAPVFMTSEEKQIFAIPEETKIQVINRGEDGSVITYKIINNDADVVIPGSASSTRPARQ